LKQPKRRNIG